MLQREPSTIVVAGQLFFTVAKLKKEKKLGDYLVKVKVAKSTFKDFISKNIGVKVF